MQIRVHLKWKKIAPFSLPKIPKIFIFIPDVFPYFFKHFSLSRSFKSREKRQYKNLEFLCCLFCCSRFCSDIVTSKIVTLRYININHTASKMFNFPIFSICGTRHVTFFWCEHFAFEAVLFRYYCNMFFHVFYVFFTYFAVFSGHKGTF